MTREDDMTESTSNVFPTSTAKAFPQGQSSRDGGMNLRDWFAGQALAGPAQTRTLDGDPWGVARAAYAYADSMMEFRERCNG